MKIEIIHETDEIQELIKNRVKFDYMYQSNNLDDREWSKTICYGLYESSCLKEIAMVYMGCDIPVLLAASFEENDYNKELIGRIKEYLPPKFYTHIDQRTLEEVFDVGDISDYQEYVNMGISDYSKLDALDRKNTISLDFNDIDKIKSLFEVSYPDNWMDDELIKFSDNFGVEIDNNLISFAGLHAYSVKQEVATIAHVTTHPSYRSNGYARDAIVALVKDLRNKVKNIGLNVKVKNLPAIKCYKNIGFEEQSRFIACEITNSSKRAK